MQVPSRRRVAFFLTSTSIAVSCSARFHRQGWLLGPVASAPDAKRQPQEACRSTRMRCLRQARRQQPHAHGRTALDD